MRILYRFIIVYSLCVALQAQSSVDTSSSEPLQNDAPIVPDAGSRIMPSTNPDISAIGDFRTSYGNQGPRNIEIYFNALEVQLSSVVDPYAEAKFLFSFGKDSLNGDYSAGLEIATLTSLSLPNSVQATLGKFKPHFTKVNQLHPHALSFIEFPVMIKNYFGDEGLFMEGLSMSFLIPNSWDIYQEVVVDIGRSATTPALDYGSGNRLLTTAQLNTFLDLSDNSTLGIGISGLSGVNVLERYTKMTGLDLTYKWKPVQFNTYHSFTWQTEAVMCRTDTSAGSYVRSFGAYSLFEYQIEKRIFLGTRFDYAGLPMSETMDERRVTVLLRLQPTEFQVFALEFQHANRNYATSVYQVMFRAIFGIGTHAAHAY